MDFFKLLPPQGDRAAYAPLVQNSGAELQDSQFKKSYDFYRRRLKDRDEDGNPLDAKRILEIVETRLMVVMINLSDNDDPYLIFESLNLKGSPLEQADLVRNYFLMRFPVSDQPGQAFMTGCGYPCRIGWVPGLTEFMRHFRGAEGEEIRKGDVYSAIKRLVTDSDTPSIRHLMSRMAQLSVFYSRIATIAPQPNEELGRFVVRFRRLEFGTAYPLLLSLYEDYVEGQFGPDEFIASLRILDSYIVRRMVVGVPSNSLSRWFSFLSARSNPIRIHLPPGCTAALARESKNRRWPTDTEFLERWLRAPIYGGRACQVILGVPGGAVRTP